LQSLRELHLLRFDTACMELDTEHTIFETTVRALAKGNSLHATAHIVQIDKDTVCDVLDSAAQHCRLLMLYLWDNLHVTECQLDELWSFVHRLLGLEHLFPLIDQVHQGN
jgi:hypothetical protein